MALHRDVCIYTVYVYMLYMYCLVLTFEGVNQIIVLRDERHIPACYTEL